MRIGVCFVAMVVACNAPGAGVRPTPPLPRATGSSSAARRALPSPGSLEPSIAVTLRPFAEGRLGLHVEVTATGDASKLRIWSRAATNVGEISHVEASDLRGRVDLTTTDARIDLARAPDGPATLRYDVALRAGERSSALTVMTDRFVANGEPVLVLPDALDDATVYVSITIDASELHAARAASSLGLGEKRSAVRIGRFLRHSTFVAGSLGTAIFDAAEGHDEAAWLGYTAFDMRAVAGELAQVRTGLADYFRAGYETPTTYIVLAETRRAGSFRVASRAESVVLAVGPREPWSAPLRIALAQQMLHTWIGGVLWLGPTEGAHVKESAWFTEGVTRFLAARLLRRFGTLSPTDTRDELVAEIAEQATSPYRREPTARLAARDDAAARTLLIARGAIYAWRLDAELRRATSGKRSIDDVMKSLYARAVETRRPLPISDFVAAVARDLGPRAQELHSALIDDGNDIVLRDDALGRCFRASQTAYTRFDLGFDEARTEDDPRRRVAGLTSDGPAARAGIREGDVIESVQLVAGDASKPATVKLSRDGRSQEIAYLPRGPSQRGPTWTRVADVPDEACGQE